MYCYLIQTSILFQLFSITFRVKEMIMLSLQFCEEKQCSFAPFKRICLRNQLFSNTSRFNGNNRKIGRGNLDLYDNRFGRHGRNRILCAEDN